MRLIAALLLTAIALAGAVATPVAVRAAHVEWDAPTADARLGEPVTFRTTFRTAQAPERVELVLSTPTNEAVTILVAEVTPAGDAWQASALLVGHTPPNTVFDFRFRALGADGFEEGPPAQVRVVDDRFDWRTVEGEIVRLHWYEGDEAFAQRALEIGEQAVQRASELLGVTESEPIDFFIYADQAALYEALGAGTRENVGGQAHADIRTMFGLIEPNEINSVWVDVLVAHELTHLVFDTATSNPFRQPPRWLNEGVATYLSEGYTAAARSSVEAAAGNGTLIPLDGLGGLFPTTANEFRLAYAISVSAVDYFVRSYSEETLWQLVRSYAEGVSDDDAFRAATGASLDDFSQAWMASLGTSPPQPYGPQPAPTGPLPPGWQGEPGPAPNPTGRPGESAPTPPVPRPGTSPGQSPAPSAPAAGNGPDLALIVAAVLVTLLVLGVLVGLLIVRRGRRADRPPPPTWP